MTTELDALKEKKKKNEATPADLTRLKLLQDGEPLSAADLEVAKKREEDRKGADKAAFEAKKKEKDKETSVETTNSGNAGQTSLDIQPDHPRIMQLKKALLPFTKIEAHDSRPDDFVLFTRDVSITAGDVRKAREAMKL